MLAVFIFAENKKFGMPPVTPQDITEGKVFIKQTFGTNGESTLVAYPIRNKQAVTELSNGVILSQMTPEQKRKYVETGFTGGGTKQTKPPQVQLSQPKVKTIKQSDVAAKAKAGGYTPSEYEALLRKNNVKIIK
jgi:hypothetical protein